MDQGIIQSYKYINREMIYDIDESFFDLFYYDLKCNILIVIIIKE